MKISVIGAGYVGLVTGVCLSELAHDVTVIDIDSIKIEQLQKGISPIYEPGLEELIQHNIQQSLSFTTSIQEGIADASVIFIAVGTPSNLDGSADLSYIEAASKSIGESITKSDVVIVTKSTVPVGTNQKIKGWLQESSRPNVSFHVASNPEFLREGSAIKDTFETDRIVIGVESVLAESILREVYERIDAPLVVTSIESAEMIKYASNAFLATKISFVNEIANLCEKLGGNIEEVANGMGLDKRIGHQFLRAGIGYGGSCFPKDTKALVQMAGGAEHHFELLESVIRVNNDQQYKLIEKSKARFTSLKGKKVAMLGLAFKPNTDDIREAASIPMLHSLLEEGTDITVYDPVATKGIQEIFGDKLHYATNVIEAIEHKDITFIVTEWEQIISTPLSIFASYMNEPVIFDGRNCYKLEDASKHGVEYYSIGRGQVGDRSLYSLTLRQS
ncbi:UDP-glucose 6-dehydrogenase [Bacillus coahuilensis m2-6]|uniref:UDP-glucose dehydrogenase family protein n=1 Tax=Bacillus coahuilensis TaxID=408580 RepID=UPI0007502E1C|nr:UDP-glucose/GDP-mannose dehydrogenase family protein [Bacillus coahuilensis]KUP05418.1 UDP-glucose 6-dehydrogenase [Bacillus coahuilensis m2-6]